MVQCTIRSCLTAVVQFGAISPTGLKGEKVLEDRNYGDQEPREPLLQSNDDRDAPASIRSKSLGMFDLFFFVLSLEYRIGESYIRGHGR